MAKTFKDYLQEAFELNNLNIDDPDDEENPLAGDNDLRKLYSRKEKANLKKKYDAMMAKEKNKKNRSTNESEDRIIFKGKEIDTNTIEYDMQDISDIIFVLEIGVKYTDGTEVEDGDMDELHELPELVDWVYQDYMDGQADKADAYRDAQSHGDFESTELDRIKELAGASIDETYDDDDDFYEAYGEMWYNEDDIVDEAEYQGRKVKLGKPMQGDVKKFKVYVKDPKTGNVKKVNFGHGGSSVKGKAMSIKKSNPARRRSFRARHNCDNPGPRTKARYWSCRKW